MFAHKIATFSPNSSWKTKNIIEQENESVNLLIGNYANHKAK